MFPSSHHPQLIRINTWDESTNTWNIFISCILALKLQRLLSKFFLCEQQALELSAQFHDTCPGNQGCTWQGASPNLLFPAFTSSLQASQTSKTKNGSDHRKSRRRGLSRPQGQLLYQGGRPPGWAAVRLNARPAAPSSHALPTSHRAVGSTHLLALLSVCRQGETVLPELKRREQGSQQFVIIT